MWIPDLILQALRPKPLYLRDLVQITGLPGPTLSSALWKLQQDGYARKVDPNLWEFVRDRPRKQSKIALKARMKAQMWARIYEHCGTLYPEHHSQRLRDRIEWAMIEEYGYIEEPLGFESMEVDGSMGSGKRAHASGIECRPWERTREQVALDEAQIRAAHSLDRLTERARRLGGLKQVYIDATLSGMSPKIVLARMGVRTVLDLEEMDRALAFVVPPLRTFVPARSRPPKRRASMQAVTEAWLRIVDQQLSKGITEVFKKRIVNGTMYKEVHIKKTRTVRDYKYAPKTVRRLCQNVKRELAFRKRLLEYVANGSPFHQVDVGILGYLDPRTRYSFKLLGIENLADLMLFTAQQLGPQNMAAIQPLLNRLNLTLPLADLVYAEPSYDRLAV